MFLALKLQMVEALLSNHSSVNGYTSASYEWDEEESRLLNLPDQALLEEYEDLKSSQRGSATMRVLTVQVNTTDLTLEELDQLILSMEAQVEVAYEDRTHVVRTDVRLVKVDDLH